MKVYILIYYDHWEDHYDTFGIFSSATKAHDYLQKYLRKYSIFEEKDFEIEEEEIDPDDSWMEE